MFEKRYFKILKSHQYLYKTTEWKWIYTCSQHSKTRTIVSNVFTIIYRHSQTLILSHTYTSSLLTYFSPFLLPQPKTSISSLRNQDTIDSIRTVPMWNVGREPSSTIPHVSHIWIEHFEHSPYPPKPLHMVRESGYRIGPTAQLLDGFSYLCLPWWQSMFHEGLRSATLSWYDESHPLSLPFASSLSDPLLFYEIVSLQGPSHQRLRRQGVWRCPFRLESLVDYKQLFSPFPVVHNTYR